MCCYPRWKELDLQGETKSFQGIAIISDELVKLPAGLNTEFIHIHFKIPGVYTTYFFFTLKWDKNKHRRKKAFPKLEG